MELSIVALTGQLVGACIGTVIWYSLWRFLLIKRIIKDPVKISILSLIAAYFTGSAIYGFGNSDADGFNTFGLVIYLFGAAVVGLFAIQKAIKAKKQSVNPRVSATFE